MHVSVWYKSFLKTRINENLKSLKRQTSLMPSFCITLEHISELIVDLGSPNYYNLTNMIKVNFAYSWA